MGTETDVSRGSGERAAAQLPTMTLAKLEADARERIFPTLPETPMR
jgi:hypothetical protein